MVFCELFGESLKKNKPKWSFSLRNLLRLEREPRTKQGTTINTENNDIK